MSESAYQRRGDVSTPIPNAPPLGGSMASLRAMWQLANSKAEAAFQQLKAAEEAAAELWPPCPAACRNIQSADPREAVPRGEIDPRDQPLLAMYDRWIAQVAAINKAFNVSSLDRMSNSAFAEVERYAAAICERTPTSAEEAAWKFEVLLHRYCDGHGSFDQPAKISEFLADLQALAASRPGLMSTN